MTEKSEWQFLVDYVKDDTTDFRNAVCRSQLMALWTAYCITQVVEKAKDLGISYGWCSYLLSVGKVCME